MLERVSIPPKTSWDAMLSFDSSVRHFDVHLYHIECSDAIVS
jgi:hypothetical protein